MSDIITVQYDEIDQEAERLRQRHEYFSENLELAEGAHQKAQDLRDQIAQSSNPEEDFSYQDRIFANGEPAQNRMLQDARLRYNAIMWAAREHYRQNQGVYISQAKRDAEAVGIQIDTSEKGE